MVKRGGAEDCLRCEKNERKKGGEGVFIDVDGDRIAAWRCLDMFFSVGP